MTLRIIADMREHLGQKQVHLVLMGSNNIRHAARWHSKNEQEHHCNLLRSVDSILLCCRDLMQFVDFQEKIVLMIASPIPSPATTTVTKPAYEYFALEVNVLLKEFNFNNRGKTLFLNMNRHCLLSKEWIKTPTVKNPKKLTLVHQEKLSLYKEDLNHLNEVGATEIAKFIVDRLVNLRQSIFD
jgi:hypothetical protein